MKLRLFLHNVSFKSDENYHGTLHGPCLIGLVTGACLRRLYGHNKSVT